jgi:hypothetical protein
MASLSKRQYKRGWCTSCGAWWKDVFTFPEGPERGDPAHRRYIDPTYPLCEDCIRRWYEGGILVQRFTESVAGPLAETSHELFRAARVLLRERVTDEDQIIPTLMVAHAIDRDATKERHWAATKKEIIRGNLKRPPQARNLSVAEVVDGILILRWEPIVAQLVWEPIFSGLVWEGTAQQLESRSWKKDGSEPLTRRWKSGPPWSQSLTDQARPDGAGILIRVYPYKEKIEAQEVASRYQEVLVAERLPFGRPRNALVEHELTGACLCLLVASGKSRPGSSVSFPSPRLVKTVSEGVLTEYEDHLVMRQRGYDMAPDNLIPACVGFLLKATWRIKGRKEVERLLDEHVLLCEIPWKALNSGDYRQKRSKKQQFWDTIKHTVHPKIERLLNDHQAF